MVGSGNRGPTGWKGRAGGSKLNLLRDAEGVIDLDTEIADGAFELRMSEEELYGSQVPRLLINLRRLGATHRVRAIRRTIETGTLNPSMDDARVLACREMRLLAETAREEVLTPYPTETGQPISDSASGLLGDFELNRSARLFLDYRRSIANPPARAHVVNFEPNKVAAPQLAVNGQIEHREIAFAAFELEPHPDRPQRPSASKDAFDRSGVPCSTAHGVEAGILGFPWGWSLPMPTPPPQRRSTSIG
jgi:hypothetical protein